MVEVFGMENKNAGRNFMTEQEARVLPVKELKAMAYDAMALIEEQQKSLQFLNQLIAQKLRTPEPKPEEKKAE